MESSLFTTQFSTPSNLMILQYSNVIMEENYVGNGKIPTENEEKRRSVSQEFKVPLKVFESMELPKQRPKKRKSVIKAVSGIRL